MKVFHFYLVFLLFLKSTNSFSQTFMQGVGMSIIKGKSHMVDRGAGARPTMDFRGITYFPRLNIYEGDQTSLSLGVPLVFGIGASFGSSINSFNYVVDLPLVADYNFGHHATKTATGIFGGYIGAGIGLTHNRSSIESDVIGDYRYQQTSYGPLARAGLRFRIPLNVGELSFTLGAFYKFGFEEERYRLRGANFLMNF